MASIPLTKGMKVVFIAADATPYYGVVQRVTGNLVTIRATGPLHQTKGSVVGTLAPNSVHVVKRRHVTPVK